MTGTIPPTELQSIQDRKLLASPDSWIKTYPNELFDEIYRLNGWGEYNKETHQTTPECGNIINDIVYDRVGSGMRSALDILNPPRPQRGQKWKNHQFLNPDDGKRLLKMHLHSLIFLMRTYTMAIGAVSCEGCTQHVPGTTRICACRLVRCGVRDGSIVCACGTRCTRIQSNFKFRLCKRDNRSLD